METIDEKNWEILFGGAEIEVVMADSDTRTLNKRRVKVRKIPLKAMAELGAVYGTDIEAEALVYLNPSDRPAINSVYKLVDDSLLAIVAKGRELNEKSFATWFELQAQAAEMMTGQKLVEKVTEAVRAQTAAKSPA
jgi:hypothetical protein